MQMNTYSAIKFIINSQQIDIIPRNDLDVWE